MAVRKSIFSHQGHTFYVTEHLQPDAIAQVTASGQITHAIARQMAFDVFEGGSGKLRLEADRISSKQTKLVFDLDLRENARLRRDIGIAATFCRIAAMFGVQLIEDPRDEVELLMAGDEPLSRMEHTLAPPSFVGDLIRAFAHLIGLGCDYAVAAMWAGVATTRRVTNL